LQRVRRGITGFAQRSKKGLLVGGGIGGVLIGLIIAIISFLPLKLEQMMKNILAKRFDHVEVAMERRAERYFERYVERVIFPAHCQRQNGGDCQAGIGGLATGSLFYDMAQAWHAGNFENKLFKNQGISFDYNRDLPPSSRYIINVKGTSQGFDRDFRLNSVTRSEMRAAIKLAVRDETKGLKVLLRKHYRTLLLKKYGVGRWNLFEDTRDRRLRDPAFKARQAMKVTMLERVVKPVTARYPAYFQCIIGGCRVGDPTDPIGRQITVDSDVDTGTSPVFDVDGNVVPDADLNDDGTPDFSQEDIDAVGNQNAGNGALENYADEAADEVIERVATEGVEQGAQELTGKAILEEIQKLLANKIVQSVGFGIGIMEIISKVDQAFTNRTISKIIEDKNKLQYANAFASWATLADQLKAGKLQGDEVQEVMSRLTNYEQSRVYGQQSGISVDPENEQCGGKTLSGDKLVCPDKRVDPNVESFYNDSPYFEVMHKIAVAYRASVGGLVSFINKVLDDILGPILNAVLTPILGALGVTDLVDKVFGAIMGWAFGPIISGNEIGSDLFNSIDAGADVTANNMGQYGIGGKLLSTVEIGELDRSVRQRESELARATGWRERFLSFDNPRSLASKLYARIPTTNNPFKLMLGLITSPFRINGGALALVTPPAEAQVTDDPYGIEQYGYSEADLDVDPDLLTSEYCAAAEEAWTADRLANGGNTTITNICRLDRTVTQAYSSVFTTADDGGLGNVTTQPTGGAGTISGTRAQLNDRLLNSPLFTGDADSRSDISNGLATDQLVTLLIQIIEQAGLPITVNTIKSGHNDCSAGGSTSNHYSGLAADISNLAELPQMHKWLYDNRVSLGIDELILNPVPPGSANLDLGQPHNYDAPTMAGHRDHIHVAVNGTRLISPNCSG
jgi:hypothetical protein